MNATHILWAAYLPVALSSIYTLLVFHKLKHEFKALAWFILLTGAIQGGSRILASQGINNYPLLHIYVGFGGVLLLIFFGKIFTGFINKKWFKRASVIYFSLVVINSMLLQDIFTFSSYSLVVEAVMVVILALSCFVLTIRHGYFEIDHERVISWDWINSGLFIYFSGNLLLYYFGETIVASAIIVKQIWTIHAVLSSIMHCCFIFGLWMRPRQ